MKHIYSIILAGLVVHFSPLSAEDLQGEMAFAFPTLPLTSSAEEISLLSLDEEFSLLDQEFKEFKEELSSIEEAVQTETQLVAINDETPSMMLQLLEEAPAATGALPVVAEVLPSEMPLENLVAFPWKEEASAPLELRKSPKMEQTAPAPLEVDSVTVDLEQAFSGSPVIYSLLLAMSIFSVCIWLYFILSMRSSARFSKPLLREVQNKLNSNQFEETLLLCEKQNTLFCKMVSSGIQSRRHGLPVMIEAMKAEGKRATISFWQKLGLLSDVAIIAPMLGLLGTVLGMFYAFYNVNRSIESISVLFDGLGVSVGTTVAGLIVAILALFLHSTAKYRLVRALAHVENEAQAVAVLIDDRTSILKR
jgi:biopolymer transport protein ExbB